MARQRAIKPELVSGTRDLLPKSALALDSVVATIRKVYESFGFVPLETPCMEKWGVLTGNVTQFNKSLFRTSIVRGAEDSGTAGSELASDDTALRFDLTVPLARVVSANPGLPKPFKRYQLGRVFRGERAQAGRFREFTQFDFDIVGSRSILADAEVIQVMYESMRALGVEKFIIRFNTRSLLNGLAELVGCDKKAKELFRVMDKASNIGVDAVLEELSRQPDNEWDESALAMSPDQTAKIKRFLEIRSSSAQETLSCARSLFADVQIDSADRGLQELETIVNLLASLGIPESFWRVDLSVARGLDYYTGPVFETELSEVPELGSVLSGGRFDGLADRFMPGSNIPGVGASVGIDRMVIGLQKLGLLPELDSITEALVTIFSSDLQETSLLFAQSLRAVGIKTELYLGEDSTLRAQFAYAAKQGISFVVVIGPDEASSGAVQLKEMRTRKQGVLTGEACIAKILSR